MNSPLILSLTLLLGACATPEDARVVSKTEPASPEQIEASRAVAKSLATQLGGKLKQELETRGPESAIGVCKVIAPQIAADLSKQTGWQVGRVGTRARNAATGTASGWNAQALGVFAERMQQGEKPDALEFAEIVTAPSGTRTLHYAKAIAMQPMCLTCHGATENLSAGIKARLQADYPLDRATGYSVGELRGAVVITRPL